MKSLIPIVLAAATVPAMADVTFTSAARRTFAAAGFAAPMSQDMSGLGRFDSTLAPTYTDAWHATDKPSWARARQLSEVGDGSIQVIGDVGGFDGYPVGGAGQGVGWSILDAAFTLDAAALVSINLDLVLGGLSQYSIRINGAGGEVFSESHETHRRGYRTWEFTAGPGDYTFTSIFSDGYGGSSTGGSRSRFVMDVHIGEFSASTSVRPAGGAIPAPATAIVLLAALRRRTRTEMRTAGSES